MHIDDSPQKFINKLLSKHSHVTSKNNEINRLIRPFLVSLNSTYPILGTVICFFAVVQIMVPIRYHR